MWWQRTYASDIFRISDFSSGGGDPAAVQGAPPPPRTTATATTPTTAARKMQEAREYNHIGKCKIPN